MGKRSILLFLLLCSLAASARNEVFNGTFELGTSGYAQKRNLRRDRNVKLEYLPPVIRQGLLEIDNPYGERFELHTKEFLLKPDTEYVFRFTAKGTVAGQKLFGVLYNVSPPNRWLACHLQLELQPEFRTAETVYRTPKKSTGYFHIHFRNVSDFNIPASNVAFKEIAVFEKGTSDENGIQAAVETAETLFVKEESSSIPLQLKIGNFSKKPFPANGKLQLIDNQGKIISSQPFSAGMLQSGEKKEQTASLATPKYGTFLVKLEIPGLTQSLAAPFAVIGKYTPKPLDLGKDFCVSINDSMGLKWFPHTDYQGYLVAGAPLEKRLEMLSKMGLRLLREHDNGYEVTSWYLLETQKGKWAFDEVDYQMDLYQKYHMELMPCIGRINFLEPTAAQRRYAERRWPDWVLPHCRRVTEYPDYTWNDIRGRILLPPVDDWRNYIRKVAEHFRGRIRYYEIFNEPNGVMGAADYLSYCRSAYEEFKKADPDAKVLGLCVTSDFGTSGDTFVADFLKLGGANAMDLASFHPYQGRELSSITPADKYIENFRKLLRKSGRDIPVWNTEIYYLYDVVSSSELQSNCTPGHVAARFLTDLGEGVGQSIALSRTQIWDNPHLLPKLAEQVAPEAFSVLVPSANFVAYNALARYFEAAKPAGKYSLPCGAIAYGYTRRDGTPIAAIWNAKKRLGVCVNLQAFEVLDVFGNPISETGKLPLDGTPYYLLPGKLSPAEFQERLKKLQPEFQNAIICSNATRKAGDTLFFTLFNMGDSPKNASVGFRGAGYAAKRAVQVMIPAKGTLDLRLELKRSGKANAPTRLQIFSDGRLSEHPVKLYEVPVQPKTPASIRREFAHCRTNVKNGMFQIGFDIADATDSGMNAAGRKEWEQDCIELFLDLDPRHFAEHHSESYTSSTIRLFYLPRAEKGKRLIGWFPKGAPLKLEDISIVETNSGAGYSVVFSLPLAKLAPYGELGFDFKVNDALPGKKAEKSVSWSNSKERHSNRCHFGILNIKENKAL